jgi:hypothetical protein
MDAQHDPPMWRMILSAVAVIAVCVLIWFYIHTRSAPPPPPQRAMPGATP